MIAIRRWLSAVVRIRSTPLVEHVHGRCVSRRDVVHDIFEIKYGVGLPLLIPVSSLRIRFWDPHPICQARPDNSIRGGYRWHLFGVDDVMGNAGVTSRTLLG